MADGPTLQLGEILRHRAEEGDAIPDQLCALGVEGALVHGDEHQLADDDGAGGCNARITFTVLEDGPYRVVASSLNAIETGAYTLRVSDRPGPTSDYACGEADPAALAATIRRLLSDDSLYRRLSENAAEALARIECPAKWGEVVARWVRDTAEDRDWLTAHTLDREAVGP